MKILIILMTISFSLLAQSFANGKLTAFCDGSHLKIDVYSKDGSSTRSVDLSLSSDCQKALSNIKTGEFFDFTVSAFCKSRDLYIVNAIANEALLSIETLSLSTSSECEEAKKSYNN